MSIKSSLSLVRRSKTKEGRTPPLNANNLPGKILPWGLMVLRESDWMVNAQKEFLLCFGREQDLKGEREKSTYWCMLIVLSLFFPSVFFLFFSFTPQYSLFFDPLLKARQGSLYSACRNQILPLCPLTALSGLGVLTDHQRVHLCATHPYQTKAGLFHSSVHRSTLTCHGINVFSLFPSRHAPNSFPLNLASFGWSVIPAGRTSQKSLGRSRKIGIFPSPHHQTIHPYLWPMTPPRPILVGYRLVVHGLHACFPFMYVQNLPAVHAFAAAWRLACTVYRLSSSFYMGYFIILYSP